MSWPLLALCGYGLCSRLYQDDNDNDIDEHRAAHGFHRDPPLEPDQPGLWWIPPFYASTTGHDATHDDDDEYSHT